MLSDNTWEELFHYGMEALDYHGRDQQLLKTAEELGELQQAIFKAMSDRLDWDNLVEEFGDVLIMLVQVKIALEISGAEISDWMRYKMQKNREKMQGG